MRKRSMAELNRLTPEQYKRIEKIPVTIILDNVRSGLNVGSVFRTADAFKVEEIILCGISQQPPHREILKTAIGATQSVKWTYFKDCSNAVENLKKDGFKIALVEQVDESILLQEWSIHSQDKIALVFGNEVNGISKELLSYADYALEVPQFGTKHSLNIAVTVGIVLWEYLRKIDL